MKRKKIIKSSWSNINAKTGLPPKARIRSCLDFWKRKNILKVLPKFVKESIEVVDLKDCPSGCQLSQTTN